jgi:hypothetical protein
VLDTNDTATGRIGGDGQAGPGHNSFAIDDAGNLVLAYHARPYPEQHTGPGAGGLFDPDRNTWFKSVNVRANGMLDLSLGRDQEVAPANRTVTVEVVVVAAPAGVQAAATTRCVAGRVVLVVSVTNTGPDAVSGLVRTSSGERTFTSLVGGKTASLTFSTRETSLAAGSAIATTTGSQSPIEAPYAAAQCG